MQLDEKVQSLIAIGASIGANCKSCLESSIAMALHNGADEREIEAAIRVGRNVKHCAESVAHLTGDPRPASEVVENGSNPCCGSAEVSS
jgi:AhpD family alkylhydroperoxidase